jgi:hypothetical protein
MRKGSSSSKRSPHKTRSYTLRNPQSPSKERVAKNDRRTNSRTSRASSCSQRSVLSDLLFEEASENIPPNVFAHEETISHGVLEKKKENEEGSFTRTSTPPATTFEVAVHEDITGSSGPFSFIFFETNANFSFIFVVFSGYEDYVLHSLSSAIIEELKAPSFSTEISNGEYGYSSIHSASFDNFP